MGELGFDLEGKVRNVNTRTSEKGPHRGRQVGMLGARHGGSEREAELARRADHGERASRVGRDLSSLLYVRVGHDRDGTGSVAVKPRTERPKARLCGPAQRREDCVTAKMKGETSRCGGGGGGGGTVAAVAVDQLLGGGLGVGPSARS